MSANRLLSSFRQMGFTLLELITTIAIAAIMLMIAAPNLNGFMRKQRVITAVDSITSAIGQARSMAIATNSYISIAPVDGVNWNSGWRVFSEGQSPDGQYTATTDKLIGQYDALPTGMAISFTSTANITGATAGSTSLTYSPVGYTVTTNKVPQVNANFTVSYGSTTTDPARMVIINALGRARTCDPVATPGSCNSGQTQ